MNTLVAPGRNKYITAGLLRLFPRWNYNNTHMKQSTSKENFPTYTGNLVQFLKAGNEDQQAQLGELWRFLSAFFPNSDLKNLDRFPMHTFIMDDGAIAVEWHFRNMAIAFDIEEDVEESGWSLSSTREAGNYSIGGYLSDAASFEKAVKQVSDILHKHWDCVSYVSE